MGDSRRLYPAALWIGTDRWPEGSSSGRHWELIGVERIQFAGFFCHKRTVFGFKFFVPPIDPVARLLADYAGSSLTHAGLERPAPLSERLHVKELLARRGLVLEPDDGSEFAEDYIPLEAASAWTYAAANRFDLYIDPTDGWQSERIYPVYAGLPTWQAAQEYLAEDWLRTAGSATAPSRWIGIVTAT
jgi:hypothetical protein